MRTALAIFLGLAGLTAVLLLTLRRGAKHDVAMRQRLFDDYRRRGKKD